MRAVGGVVAVVLAFSGCGGGDSPSADVAVIGIPDPSFTAPMDDAGAIEDGPAVPQSSEGSVGAAQEDIGASVPDTSGADGAAQEDIGASVPDTSGAGGAGQEGGGVSVPDSNGASGAGQEDIGVSVPDTSGAAQPAESSAEVSVESQGPMPAEDAGSSGPSAGGSPGSDTGAVPAEGSAEACGTDAQDLPVDADTADRLAMCVDETEIIDGALAAADGDYTAADTSAPQLSAAECFEMAHEGHIQIGGGTAGTGLVESPASDGGLEGAPSVPAADRPYSGTMNEWCSRILSGAAGSIEAAVGARADDANATGAPDAPAGSRPGAAP